MMNEIVVTRAPRLKLVASGEVPKGSVYMCSNGDIYMDPGYSPHALLNSGPDDTPDPHLGKLWDVSPGRVYFVFESFDAMCKWVAGGRKLEDLQGGCKGELVPTNCLYAGQTGVVVASDFGRFNAGDVVMAVKGTFFDKSASGIVSLIDGDCCPYTIGAITTGIENILVWPLGPEDSITITVKP